MICFYELIDISLCHFIDNILICIIYCLWDKYILPVIIAIVVLLFWEWLTKPKLKISRDKSWGNDHEHPSKKFMFYHLNVRNKNAFCILTRRPAMSCLIKIEVLGRDKKRAIYKDNLNPNKPFIARWTAHPVPILEGNKIDTKQLLSLKLLKHDVYGHEDELVPIAIKYENESSCYMFNNESYIYHDGKNPDFKLKPDVYCLKVKAFFYKKKPYTKYFMLKNLGICYKQLELEEICSLRKKGEVKKMFKEFENDKNKKQEPLE